MLYLDIQKGKEKKNTEEFQKDIGETETCIKIITKVTKGCGNLSSINTIFDIWFIVVKKDEEYSAEGVDICVHAC